MTCVKNYKVLISAEQIANKCLNVCERVKVLEGVKDGAFPSPAALWIVSVYERKPR